MIVVASVTYPCIHMTCHVLFITHVHTHHPNKTQALTRGFVMDSDVDLEDIASRCNHRVTGADLYALCADAWMAALKRTIELAEDETAQGDEGDGVQGGDVLEGGDAQQRVMVCQGDFLMAVRDLTPSISEEELARYEALRGQYEHRA